MHLRRLFLTLLIAIAVAGVASAAEYVGSEKCKVCHSDIYDDFIKTGHPYKLRPADEARAGSPENGIRAVTEIPEGVSWDDVSYVIGGVWWKTRFINETGYIITGDKVQYNIETGEWVAYHPGEVKPYNCGRCHTTGYSEDGNQDGLPGLEGTWAFPGIECEACHGPGGDHIKAPSKDNIVKDESKELCGKCHIRGDKDSIPAKGGFIRHHEQYNELLASPMKDLNCVTCHDPHKSVKNPTVTDAIKIGCESCHSDAAKEYEGTVMDKAGVECIDCHMPRASKSAVAKSQYEGDIRTHLFAISIDPNAKIFTDDGKYVAGGYVTVEYACLGCHKDKDREWALKYAPKAMTLKEEVKPTPPATPKPTTPPPTPTPTPEKQPGFEAIFAIAGVLAVLYFLRRK
jgi:predicted CXXCH cytochrome family protein